MATPAVEPPPAPVDVPLPPAAAPVPPGESTLTPVLVPLSVSRAKLAEELAQWAANAAAYRQRGWLLLGVDDLTVDVGFLANVAVGHLQIPIMTATIRLRYDNYDLWPPSLTFIEPWTGQLAPPPVAAPDTVDGQVRNVLLGRPGSGEPFLCVAGLREYHEHPQHSGDEWLLHRRLGAGRLAVVCDRVWRRMARNVIGLTVHLQSLPRSGTELQVALAQGDVDTASAPAAASQAGPVAS